MNEKTKKLAVYGGIAAVVLIVLALVIQYYTVPVILAAGGCYWLYGRIQESKENQQQQALENRQRLYDITCQTVFNAAVKLSDILPYKRPVTLLDITMQPSIVNFNGIPILQFKLVKKQLTNAPDTETCQRIEYLLQNEITSEIRASMVPNLPFLCWKARDGREWPIFTIGTVKEDPLYYIVLLAVVDNENTAQFLSKQKFGRHNPPPNSHNDPDF
ncbi:hypothetical protein [Caproiciproducens galactitolivorans]|uniref:hypothetical protein n=1 Tax=Caproiciproducens galactitolivorans TaxID=642589 RepID=UPI00240950CD|nr:hypothetical protein [Caproiciproducens galactitolivorans]